MKIIRARHLGMCFGVKDAIDLALQASEQAPLTILGELVHNDTVNAELRARGVSVVREPERVQTRLAMITAHGASDKMKQEARNRGLQILEATCPLVQVAHRAILRLVAEGYHPVILGKRDHVEVRGLTEDLQAFDVVQDEADIERVVERPRFGVAAQTTQPIERVHQLVESLHQRYPDAEIKFVDTVCQPTKQRQMAAVELARQAELVLVVGGAHSNNTRELCATCRQYCPRVYHVQTAADLRPEWFSNVATVGLTAGTSTPDPVIDEIENWLQTRAEVHPESKQVAQAGNQLVAA
jgi:4-hydroxy-3-methylbut-2-enyl diphosphate reductase